MHKILKLIIRGSDGPPPLFLFYCKYEEPTRENCNWKEVQAVELECSGEEWQKEYYTTSRSHLQPTLPENPKWWIVLLQ